ncbi:MAG: sugar nucleotide-binding protein, partial [Thermodesulfobacteriota bacterium]
NNFVRTVMRLAGEREELGVVFDQVGTPTYTADLAKAVAALMEAGRPGTYHFSNEGVASWYDFAHEIVGRMKEKGSVPLKLRTLKPILTEEYPTPARRPNYTVMHKGKYKKTTGREVPHWKDALKRFMDTL